MQKQPITSITRHFGGLSDPRTGNAKAHIFLEILIIAICAVIWGADSWSDVELFGQNKRGWLKIAHTECLSFAACSRLRTDSLDYVTL